MASGELAAAFGAGLLATFSPCVLPLYPAYLSFVGGRSAGAQPSRLAPFLGFFVLLGVLTAMLVIGGVIAAMSIAASQVLVILTPLTALVVIGLGIAMLAGLNPLGRLPTIGAPPGRGGGATAAYSYGLLFGPMTLPCSGALVVGIFTLSLTVSSFLDKIVFFLVFGLGFGLPLLVLSVLAGGYQARLLRLATHHFRLVNRLAGAVLVAVGAWSLCVSLPLLRLYFGT